MIEGVTFDWWNTIGMTTEDQDRRLRERRIDALLAAARSLPATQERLLEAYDRQTAFLQDLWDRNADLPAGEQIDVFLRFAGLDDADDALRTAASEAFGGALIDLPPALFPHIIETLEGLEGRGLAIGMVSNTGRTWGRYMRKVQDRLGIGRFFDVRVFSDEVGVRKPESGIFQTALDGLGLPAERVVHVGDDVAADVAGAKAIGMRAIWFDAGRPGHRPGFAEWSDEAIRRADAVIRGHAELPEILDGWEK